MTQLESPLGADSIYSYTYSYEKICFRQRLGCYRNLLNRFRGEEVPSVSGYSPTYEPTSLHTGPKVEVESEVSPSEKWYWFGVCRRPRVEGGTDGTNVEQTKERR